MERRPAGYVRKPAGYVLVVLDPGRRTAAPRPTRTRGSPRPSIRRLPRCGRPTTWRWRWITSASLPRYWRLPGNPGYNASIDRISNRLAAAGLAATIEEYPNSGQAWDYTVGTLALVNAGAARPGRAVEGEGSRSRCASTRSAPRRRASSRRWWTWDEARRRTYAGKDVKGAVVLGDASPGSAVEPGSGGRRRDRRDLRVAAAGVRECRRPGAAVTPRDQWDIFQWTSVPYDEARKAFGFKASARTADAAQADGGRRIGPVSVRVTVASSFSSGPARTLVAEIPGRTAPGAQSSWPRTSRSPARTTTPAASRRWRNRRGRLRRAIAPEAVAPPERTLTFLLLNEISGSRRLVAAIIPSWRSRCATCSRST